MPIRHIALALLVVMIWGFNFVVIKLSVEAFPPLFAAALRFLAAAVPAVFLVRPPKAHWPLVVGFGLAFGFALYGFLNLALAWGMPAGLASLVLQVQAFFTMALAFVLLGERPSRFQIIGAIIAFGGIGVIALSRLGGTALLPLGMTLLAAFCWAIANVLTKRSGKVNALSFTAWGVLAAPVPLLMLSLIFEGTDAIIPALQGFGWNDALTIGFLAYPATLLGTTIWSWLLGRHPASTVAPFTLLVPITGIISGYFVLGEHISVSEITGAILVLIGLMVTVVKIRRRHLPINPGV